MPKIDCPDSDSWSFPAAGVDWQYARASGLRFREEWLARLSMQVADGNSLDDCFLRRAIQSLEWRSRKMQLRLGTRMAASTTHIFGSEGQTGENRMDFQC